MFNQRIAALPRFVNPVTSLVVRHLQHALMLQREAASSTTAAEFEVRLGNFSSSRRLRTGNLPIQVSSQSVLSDADKHLYTFTPGLDPTLLEKLLADLVAVGLASANTISMASADSLVLHAEDAERFHFRITGGEQGNKEGDVDPSTLAGRLFAWPQFGQGHPQHNPSVQLRSRQARYAEWESATVKHSVGLVGANMCCPEWSSDIRFSLATEDTIAGGAAPVDPPPLTLARMRRRLSLPIEPYLRLDISAERSGTNVYPFERLLAQASQRSQAGTQQKLPLPPSNMPVLQFHVEVEVLLPRLLRDWKRYHGTAVVSPSTRTASSPPAALVEDPLLLRVAEDLLTLLQFVAARR